MNSSRRRRPSAAPAVLFLLLLLALAALAGSSLYLGEQLIRTGEDLETVRGEAAQAREEADVLREELEALRPREEPPRTPKPQTGEDLSASDILAGAKIIAHGMGKLPDESRKNVQPVNCLESFLAQYEAGVRVFEIDLRLTRDCQVVLRHDWWPLDWQEGIDGAHIPTREEFLSKPIMGKYTPLSFRDVLLLLEEYPDICVVTDTKFIDPDVIFVQFGAMLADAEELGLPHLFDRVVIQLYTGVMRQCLENIYPFPHRIYTLYQRGFKETEEDFREVASYCAEYGIEGITLCDVWWREAYAPIAEEYGIKVYVHTVNDAAKAEKFFNSGISAVYTDSLLPADLA